MRTAQTVRVVTIHEAVIPRPAPRMSWSMIAFQALLVLIGLYLFVLILPYLIGLGLLAGLILIVAKFLRHWMQSQASAGSASAKPSRMPHHRNSPSEWPSNSAMSAERAFVRQHHENPARHCSS